MRSWHILNSAALVVVIVLFVPSLGGNGNHLQRSSLTMELTELLTIQQENKPALNVSLECVAEHCLAPSLACVESRDCRESINCVKDCLQAWDNDTTDQKLHVQNCTNICAFSYADEVFVRLMSCYTDHACISLPPIPSMCLSDGYVLKQLTIKDLAEQSWWVVKGLNQLYDCYPCQSMQFNQISSTLWEYTPQYEVYLHNGSLRSITQHLPIPSQPLHSTNISFLYHDFMGLKHSETWWLLNEADDKSWIATYYCGNTLEWHYQGALVLATNRTLVDHFYIISDTYRSTVGTDLSMFCSVPNPEDCPNKV